MLRRSRQDFIESLIPNSSVLVIASNSTLKTYSNTSHDVGVSIWPARGIIVKCRSSSLVFVEFLAAGMKKSTRDLFLHIYLAMKNLALEERSIRPSQAVYHCFLIRHCLLPRKQEPLEESIQYILPKNVR